MDVVGAMVGPPVEDVDHALAADLDRDPVGVDRGELDDRALALVFPDERVAEDVQVDDDCLRVKRPARARPPR
jgi:hypothetical protein